jgi:hypothetical protein
MNDSLRFKIIPSTYIPVGNDGLHFNKGISDAPANTSVPSNILTALVSMSDHMPVRADYAITPAKPVNAVKNLKTVENIRVVNPFSRHISISFTGSAGIKKYSAELFSITGGMVFSKEIISADNVSLCTGNILPGIYFLKLDDREGNIQVKKLIRSDIP